MRVGAMYLLETDVNLRVQLKTMRQAKAQLESAVARRVEIEDQLRAADITVVEGLTRMVEINQQMEKARKVPTRYNELVAQVHAIEAQLAEAKVFVADRQKALARISVPNDQYVSAVVQLSDAMEAAQRQYDALTTDAAVKAALAVVNKTSTPPVKLGPSEAFKTELPAIRQERNNVRAEGIKLSLDTGVPMLSASLNGKPTPIQMVVDSGASDILLSAEAAHEAGLDDEPAIGKSRGLNADGKITETDVKLIKSVRVGQFVVENVLCSIARKGEGGMNLLGGEFLHHFIYRMDLEAGELYLSPIGAKTDNQDTPAGKPESISAAPPKIQPGWNDLLRFVSIERDSLRGNWSLQTSRLLVEPGAHVQRLRVPVRPGGNYELRITFERPKQPKAPDGFGVYLPVINGGVVLIVNAGEMGLDMVDDKRASSNETHKTGDFNPSRPHDLYINVSSDASNAHIKVLVDGQPQILWDGSISRLSTDSSWAVPSPMTLGFGAWRTGYLITRAELKENSPAH